MTRCLANIRKTVLAALALALGGSPLVGQGAADPRWTPFLGCWEPVGETEVEGMLCVRPSGAGVEIFTWSEGEQVTSDELVADGSARTAAIEGCEGEESSAFSADGRRVFTRSNFTCGQDARRESSGIMSMLTPTEWTDVHSLDVDGDRIAWVQHYRLAAPARLAEEGLDDVTEWIGMAVRTARVSASRTLSLGDVVEASGRVHDKAVEAWLASRAEPFEVDGDDLGRLADQGVAESVIDVVVAVSHPEAFVIDGGGDVATADRELGEGQGLAYRPAVYGPYGFRSFFGDPLWGYGYGYYSRGWGPYSSPYYYRGGYGYGWPHSYGGGYYHPTRVVIVPRSRGGKVVKGSGYTQGRGSSGASAAGSSSRDWPSAGSSGSSGRTGGSTVRTAKPRGGGSTGTSATPSVGKGRPSASVGKSSSGTGRTTRSATGRKAKPKGGGKQ